MFASGTSSPGSDWRLFDNELCTLYFYKSWICSNLFSDIINRLPCYRSDHIAFRREPDFLIHQGSRYFGLIQYGFHDAASTTIPATRGQIRWIVVLSTITSMPEEPWKLSFFGRSEPRSSLAGWRQYHPCISLSNSTLVFQPWHQQTYICNNIILKKLHQHRWSSGPT